MRKYHGQKVLYYNHEAMFRENPIKWVAFFAVTVSGALFSYTADRFFPNFLEFQFHDQTVLAITVVPILAGLALYILWWIRNYSHHRLVITAKNLYVLKGIILVKAENIRLENIQTFAAQPDNIWELLVGIGTVQIGTSSGEGYEHSLNGMPHIKKISRLFILGRDE